MRKVAVFCFIFGVIFFSNQAVMAAEIGLANAEKIVRQWAEKQPDYKLYSADISDVIVHRTEKMALLYIANLNGGGFVIIGGDDNAQPVLGYSYTGHIVEGKTSPSFDSIISSYKKQIENVAALTVKIPSQPKTIGGVVESVGPLLMRDGVPNTWGQDAPYNKLTPLEGGQVTHVGCGAMSMAQIMWYYEHPKKGTGSFDGINFGATEYHWDLMPTALTANSSQEEIDAVTTMLYHVGVSISMRYHAGDQPSLAYQGDIGPAYVDYFRYNAEYRDNFIGTAGLAQSALALKEELDNIPDTGVPAQYINRPVQFNALKPAGHGFVCDGYENRGAIGDAPEKYYFHFNFGWNGADNGYFLLSAIGPVHGGDVTFIPNYKINYKIYPIVDSCDDTICSGHGSCVNSGGTITCECDNGYHAKSYQCIKDEEVPDDATVGDDDIITVETDPVDIEVQADADNTSAEADQADISISADTDAKIPDTSSDSSLSDTDYFIDNNATGDNSAKVDEDVKTKGSSKGCSLIIL